LVNLPNIITRAGVKNGPFRRSLLTQGNEKNISYLIHGNAIHHRTTLFVYYISVIFKNGKSKCLYIEKNMVVPCRTFSQVLTVPQRLPYRTE